MYCFYQFILLCICHCWYSTPKAKSFLWEFSSFNSFFCSVKNYMEMSQKYKQIGIFFILLHIIGMPPFGFEHHQNPLFNFRPRYIIATLCPYIQRSRMVQNSPHQRGKRQVRKGQGSCFGSRA